MIKKRKAQKKHNCDYCETPIQKGDNYIFESMRLPKYNDNDEQVGIEYLSLKRHIDDCTKVECEKHNYIKEMDFDHYVGCHKVYVPTGNMICDKCGDVKYFFDV